MKTKLIIAAMLAAAGLAGAQMFAQMFGGSAETPIPAVAWYKLDGNALDSSGNGYDGTWTRTEAYTNGSTLQASWHDNSYIAATSLTNSVLFAGDDREFTVAVWAKPVVPITRNLSVVSQSSGGAAISQFQMFYATGDVISMYCRGSLTTITGVSPGEWQHIAVTWDKTAMAVYIDGVLWGAGNVGAAAALPLAFFEIGARGSTGTNPFLGAIDDVRVFNRALSHANIQRIMTGQTVEPIEELQ